jgi:hypothetical protein
MPVRHCEEELINAPHREQTQEPKADLLLRLALASLFSLNTLSRTSLRLAHQVNCDAAVVATTYRTCSMRHAHSPTLALHKRVSLKGMVRTGVSRLRPVMSHPIDHTRNIAKKAQNRNKWIRKAKRPGVCTHRPLFAHSSRLLDEHLKASLKLLLLTLRTVAEKPSFEVLGCSHVSVQVVAVPLRFPFVWTLAGSLLEVAAEQTAHRPSDVELRNQRMEFRRGNARNLRNLDQRRSI